MYINQLYENVWLYINDGWQWNLLIYIAATTHTTPTNKKNGSVNEVEFGGLICAFATSVT